MTLSEPRPGGVTVIATLCAIFGVLEIVAATLALAFLAAFAKSSGIDSTLLFWSAISTLILGVAYLLVSGGLYRGRDVARVIVLLVSLVHAVNGLWLAVTGQLTAGLVTIAVALLICALLWTGRGARYFARTTLAGGPRD